MVDTSSLEGVLAASAGGGGVSLGNADVDDPKADDAPETFGEMLQSTTEPTAWVDALNSQMYAELRAVGDVVGETKYVMDAFLENNWSALLEDLEGQFFSQTMMGMDGQPIDPNVFLTTVPGFNAVVRNARGFLRSKWSAITEVWQGIESGSTSGSGGGSGARKFPTEEEIRQQFDVDQLALSAQNTWRGLLLDENADPRALAREYVDAVVATKGQQKLDFNTFVINRAKNSARYGAIYKNKPASMTEGQFISPYLQAAQQVVGSTDEATELGMKGAMFGASSPAFQARLQRTDAVTQSAPFITGMENRLTDLRKVFRE